MTMLRVCSVALSINMLLPLTTPVLAGGADTGRELTGSSWLLREIEGRSVLENTRATLSFESAEKVAGDGGCNRFFGSVEIDGGAISFGPLGATRRACGEAIDGQEIRYLGALAKAAAFSLEADELVVVTADETILLRFDRAD